MKRLLSLLVVLSLFLLSSGCGNVFVRGAIETGSTIQGFVTVVQLGNTLNGMETVQVTFVTLLQNSTSSTVGFCGDQRDLAEVRAGAERPPLLAVRRDLRRAGLDDEEADAVLAFLGDHVTRAVVPLLEERRDLGGLLVVQVREEVDLLQHLRVEWQAVGASTGIYRVYGIGVNYSVLAE